MTTTSSTRSTIPYKVISGGQTGIDRMGLEVARALGIPTGGTAPKGWRTEEGPMPDLAGFGLVEAPHTCYLYRTVANVLEADLTVVLGKVSSAGSLMTRKACVDAKKPCLCNPTVGELYKALLDHQVKVLNVAGNRLSRISVEELAKRKQMLGNALSLWIDQVQTKLPF